MSARFALLRMPEAKVKSGDEEFPIEGGISIGRTPDNSISFPDDGNISRNHAEIRERDGAYYLTDLGSSNGTRVNGIPFEGAYKLGNGDYIILGNSKTLVFELVGEEDDDVVSESFEPEPTPEEKKKNRAMLAGAGGALVLAMAIGGGAIYMASGSSCAATARIVSPEPGETISEATEIEVESENAGCVAKAVFTIDGVEFASTNMEPFEATIDPKEHPDLADGFDHALGIVLIDKYGERIYATQPLLLAFETRKVEPPSNTTVAQNNSNTGQGTSASKVTLIDIQQMSMNLAKQMSPGASYNLSNRQFLEEVQKLAAEYAQAGYFDKAARYRDAIRVPFVRGQNLDPALGFYLAMSRSKFDPSRKGNEEGLFRMTTEFVTANAYNGECGSETLSDQSQECAAKAAALYMKAIATGVFEGDLVLSAAAFGKSPADASVWKASLPANRADVWSAIKTSQEREQLARFFAAAIVAENPQKFGLKDRPLAELYKVAM